MKIKVIIPLLFSLLLFSCEKSSDDNVFTINADAKIFVKPATESINVAAKSDELTPLEVVKQATFLVGYNNDIAHQSPVTWTWVGKDTISEIPALLRWGTDIIYDTTGYGDYGIQTEFINAYDLVICTGNLRAEDTIAYIPNANMTSAKALIIEAFANQDTAAVYNVFKDAFKFIPITGSGWRSLKAQGLN